MDRCKRCGADIEPGQKMCENCGLRLAPTAGSDLGHGLKLAGHAAAKHEADSRPIPSAPKFRPTAPIQSPSPEAVPAPDFAQGAPEHKSLCTVCMNSFDALDLADFKGKPYCPECFAKVSKDAPDLRGAVSVEVAGGALVEQKPSLALKIVVVLGFVLLIAGTAGGLYYIMTQKTPLPRPVGDDVGTETNDMGSAAVPGGSPAAINYPSIEVPISPDDKSFQCPVCQRHCLVFGAEHVICSGCGRKLVPVPASFPDVKYVGKEGDIAVFKRGKNELRVAKGEEILKGSEINVSDFETDGVVLTKTVAIDYEDYREEHRGEKRQEIIIRKKIPKFRESGPIPVEVMQNTKSIICNGRGENRIYHAEPIIIPLGYDEPGVYQVPCTSPDCWNTFRVTINELPEIRCPISATADQVQCPQCGCSRFLVPRGQPIVFTCVDCERKIGLYLWRAIGAQYVGRDGKAAIVRHEGKEWRVEIGKELWPQAGAYLDSFEEEGGREYVRVHADVDVKFTDHRGLEPVERSRKVRVTDMICKEGG